VPHLNIERRSSLFKLNMVYNIPRALEYLAESSGISIEAVQEDQEEEIESFQSALDIEDCEAKCDGHYLHKPSKPDKKAKVDHAQLKGNLKKASEHIIVSGTQTEYRR
jgi:hypothetical protein